MKIQYFYAENMTGIKVGTKLDTIEIDFSETTVPINLLLGSNGSGKSSLLSILHPLRDCYDGRKPVRDKTKAYKEIHLTDDDNNYYIIKHAWKPNKSFIEKNDEELNESGSIKEFLILAEKELGINNDFFKIGRLGDNMVNFIKLKSTDRKLYMANYFPKTDDYLKMHEGVRKLYVSLNKTMTSLASQLEKFPEIDFLEEKINNLSKVSETINKKLITLNKKISSIETKIKDEENKLYTLIAEGFDNEDIKDEEELKTLIKDCNENIKKSQKFIDKVKYKYQNFTEQELPDNSKELDLLLENYNSDLIKYNKKVANYEARLKSITKEKDDLSKRKTVLEKYIEDSKSNESSIKETNKAIKDFENTLSKNNDSLELLKEQFNLSHLNFLDNMYNDKKDEALVFIFNMQKEFSSVFKTISEVVIPQLTEYSDYSYEEIYQYIELNKSYEEEITEYERQLDNIKKKIYAIESNVTKLDILENRPNECKIDSCSFIKDAFDYKVNEYDKLPELKKKANKIEKQLNASKNLLELSNNLTTLKNDYKRYVETNINNLLTKYSWTPLDEDFVVYENEFDFELKHYDELSSFLINTNLDRLESLFDIEDSKKYISLSINNDNLENSIKDQKKYLKSLQRENESLESRKTELDEILSWLSTIKENEESCKRLLDKNKNLLDGYNNIIEMINNMKIAINDLCNFQNDKEIFEEILDEYNAINEELSTLRKQKSTLNDELISLEDEKDINKKEYDKYLKDYHQLQLLQTQKEELDNKFNNTVNVLNILDPKKGIPLELISRQLQKFKDKTNDLLKLAYNGEFSIDFNLTDKDFFITVKRNTSELEDISLASQGETSLTTLSLSLSMLGKYNILYLDELDGPLSSRNRRIFFDILELLINELNIQQVFIITHNNEFLSTECNMILFDMSELDGFDKTGKNIIFDLETFKKTLDD